MITESLGTLVSGPTAVAIAGGWLTMSIKGSALIGVAWLVGRAMRRGSAAVRHAIWASALAGSLLLPLLAIAVPAIQLRGVPDVRLSGSGAFRQTSAPPSIETTPSASADVTLVLAEGRVASVAPMRELESAPIGVEPSHATTTLPRTPPIQIKQWIPLALLVGVWLLLLRAIAGALQLSLWTRRASAVDDAAWLSLAKRLATGMRITRPVTLLRSDRACVPMTWGVIYPRVLLPTDADVWTSDRRTIVLLHELAHVKRLDAFTQFVAQLAVAVFWFNPLVWFAARQMRIEREHACDDLVLDTGARASDYAHDLLQIARSLAGGSAPAAAALAMARRSELEGRLLAILDPRANRRPASRPRLVAVSLGIIALSLPLAALRPVAQQPSRVSPSAPSSVILMRAPKPGDVIPTRASQPEDVILMRAQRAEDLSPPRQLNSLGTKAISRRFAPQDDPALPPLAASVASTPVRIAPPTPRRLEAPKLSPSRVASDPETLIAVARAAAKLTSDHDKAELLLEIAKRYVRDDELRNAYLDAVASMTSDYERGRTLEPWLLKDSLPTSAVAKLVRIASRMTSDNLKGILIVQIARGHPSLTPAIGTALIAMTTSMTSDFERGRAIVAIAGRDGLSTTDVIGLIHSTQGITSSLTKASALIAIASRYTLSDKPVRMAYISAAETISSASDYRRAILRVLE